MILQVKTCQITDTALLMAVFLLSFLWISPPALAVNKIALVVGNNTYENITNLKKPVTDAESISKALTALDFNVIQAIDVTRRLFNQKFQEFISKIQEGDVALIYYAGHSVEIAGKNYLLPVDVPPAQPGQEGFIGSESIGLGTLLGNLTRKAARLNVVVLDACRDNPFINSKSLGVGGTRGLAPVRAPKNTMVLYSAGVGEAALGGLSDADSNQNSIFVRTLISSMSKPGVNLKDMAAEVSKSVSSLAATISHEQTPAIFDQTGAEFLFVEDKIFGDPATDATAGTAVTTDQNNYEIDFWEEVKASPSEEMYEAYLAQYPEGHFARIAKIRLRKFQPEAVQVAQLVVSANIPVDNIRINGEDLGPARQDLELKPGKYTIEVTKKGYRKFEKSVVLKAGFKQTVDAQLIVIAVQQPVPTTIPEPNQYGLDMVRIAGGELVIGSPESEPDRKDNEKQFKLQIDSFRLNRTEVTVAAFEKFVAATGYRTDAEKNAGGEKGCWAFANDKWVAAPGITYKNPGFAQTGKHPVVCVSNRDTSAYIKWLNEVTGRAFRLPTEAEWEYAARAGVSRARFWGQAAGNACRYANIADQGNWKSNFPCNDRIKFTAPVGSYESNPYGLKDTLGNVWEWTCSNWRKSYNDSANRCSRSANRYALRGGSWLNDPARVRAAARFNGDRAARLHNLGFRLVEIK